MSMNLSGKQRDELNRAIADYLQSSGYHASFSAFMGEADLNENVGDLKSSGLLEKKWTSVLRLQKKVMDLESKLKETEKEIASGAPTRDKRKPEEWIPRAPERFELSGHRMPVNRVIFHPKYTYFASCSEDCTIKIWDFESGEFERTLKGHTAAVQDICFDKSGTLLASCSADLTIKIWDFVNSYECTKTLKGHDHNISSITFVPSGDYLLSSSRDRQVKMWEVSTGYCIHTFGGHTDWVRMVRVSHDGSQFATCGNDHTVRVWSIQGKAEKMTLHGHEHVVECVTWVPDAALPYISHQDLAKMNGGGSVAASAESNALLLSGSRDKTIRCWNVHTNQCLFVLTGHDNWVRGIVFHPHGKFIVSVSDDKSMKIWATEGRRCQKTISAHGKFVTSIDFHSKLPYVVTGSEDMCVKVWECR
ncbi:hypothetical protein QR680_013180 [Steinernema hermaphroditum]|uniref:Lissencephaly-1 homolog n=1 Tax=Steinernema hermaphroditum TaxID=289476 RepID=A0AA39M240_9BILA|nr:hypothetical protein QR680_013180 [Steinernema hermaphroditum]